MLAVNWYPDDGFLRRFGVISVAGFGLIGLVLWGSTGRLAAAATVWGIGLLAGAAATLRPSALYLPYLILTAVSFPVGWVVSNLLFGALFYGIFWPLGRTLRYLGHDALLLKRHPGPTHWREVRQPREIADYYRQV